EHLQAVEPTPLQPDVEEDQARPARMDGAERVVAVTRDARGVTLVLEYPRDQFADVSLVVDDQDVGSHSPCSFVVFLSSVVVAATGSEEKRRRIHAPRWPGNFSAASWSSIRPPCSSRILPTMASPNPVPFSRVVT